MVEFQDWQIEQLRIIGRLIRNNWSGVPFDGRDIRDWINATIEGKDIRKQLKEYED